MRGGFDWTDEREIEVVRLWREGLTASQVAQRLGGDCTRNSVIGKLHRIGCQDRRAYRNQVPTRVTPTIGPVVATISAPLAPSDSIGKYFRLWSSDDIAKATHMGVIGLSIGATAAEIGRTPKAVQTALARGGVKAPDVSRVAAAGGYTNIPWSGAEIARAAEMRRDGASFDQIAVAVGHTAGAVKLRLVQLGVRAPAKPLATSFSAVAKRAARSRRSPGAIANRHATHLASFGPCDARFACEIAPAPEGGSITIIDLTERTCRWPFGSPSDLGSFRYCGAEKAPDAGPYCRAHKRLAINPAGNLKRRVAHA